MSFHDTMQRLQSRPWWPAAQFLGLTAVAVLVWKFRAALLQDLVVWGAFIWALYRQPRFWTAWRNPAGAAFALFGAYIVASLAWSVETSLTARDLVRMADAVAAMIAIPILFNTRGRVESALFYTASGFTALLGADLVRLLVRLKGEALARAHYYEPFELTHPNTSAMAAGVSALILLYFAWTWRRRGLRPVACALAALVDLAYLVVIASRGPQVAFAAAIVLAGVVVLPGWKLRLAWLCALGVAGSVLWAHPEWINPRFADKASMRGFCDRDKVWQHSWELSKQRPLLGYGYGEKLFRSVYHNSNPPESPFHYKHTHQYLLFYRFSLGWIGVALCVTAWALLLARLIRRSWASAGESRLLPALILVLLGFIQVYGLADWPGSLIGLMLMWLIPLALVVTSRSETA